MSCFASKWFFLPGFLSNGRIISTPTNLRTHPKKLHGDWYPPWKDAIPKGKHHLPNHQFSGATGMSIWFLVHGLFHPHPISRLYINPVNRWNKPTHQLTGYAHCTLTSMDTLVSQFQGRLNAIQAPPNILEPIPWFRCWRCLQILSSSNLSRQNAVPNFESGNIEVTNWCLHS